MDDRFSFLDDAFYRWSKHSAQGNTFIVLLKTFNIANDPQTKEDPVDLFSPEIARKLCDSEDGLGRFSEKGADGYIYGLIEENIGAVAVPSVVEGTNSGNRNNGSMDLLNADGSAAEISGNGLRCLLQAMSNAKKEDRGVYHMGTSAGHRYGIILSGGAEEFTNVKVEMGTPQVAEKTEDAIKAAKEVPKFIDARYVDVGNPHLVVALEDLNDFDLEKWGPAISQNAIESGLGELNVEFVAIANSQTPELKFKVYERGVGITQACGSGAVASVAALREMGTIQATEATVNMDGGRVEVSVSQDEGGEVYHLAGEVDFIENFSNESVRKFFLLRGIV